MATVTTSHTQQGTDDNSQSTEKPDDGKAVKSGLGEAVGWATAPLTLTWGAFYTIPRTAQARAIKATAPSERTGSPVRSSSSNAVLWSLLKDIT